MGEGGLDGSGRGPGREGGGLMAPIWTHPLTWTQARAGAHLRLEATPETRAKLAKELGAEGLSRLVAELEVRPWRDGAEITGRVNALAQRLCGISLEPMDETIDEPLLIRLVPAGSANAPRSESEVTVALEEEDPADVVDGGQIDVAHYVVEALALALDPFPRKSGVVFDDTLNAPATSPFAVLRNLTPRDAS